MSLSIFFRRLPLLSVFSLCAQLVLGAESAKSQADLPPIAAMVEDVPVFVAEVNTALAGLAKNRQVSPKGLDTSKAEVLRDLVNRRLAERALIRDGSYFKKSEVDRTLTRIRNQLESQKSSLEQHAARMGISTETIKLEATWRLAWQSYVERNLTSGLEQYFKEHHRDFDGTEVRASHIVLRADKAGQPVAQLVAQAEKIRAEIEAGKISFEDAATKYSAGPSREHDGDLGFLPRYGVMVNEFAKAAFALEKDELSPPVVTAFGVHLIKVTDEKPGNKKWTEVVEQIKQPAELDLFEKLAAKERENANIEFTGKMPYFKPGTDELVLPRAGAN